MTDFGGKGSRRVFAARLLREAQTQASTSVVSLVPSIVAMPVGTLVSTDRLPAVSTAGAAKTLTPANFRAYILPDGDKGDITTSASGATWTIDNGVVSYAKIQNVAANSFLANVTGSPASAQEIATTRIPLFASAITGTPSGTTYLRGDGTWATVTGGSGDVVGPASATDNAVARFDTTTGKLIKDSRLIVGDGTIDITSSIGGSLGIIVSDVLGPSFTGTGSSPAAGISFGSIVRAIAGIESYAALSTSTDASTSGGTWTSLRTDATATNGSGTVTSLVGHRIVVDKFFGAGTLTTATGIGVAVGRTAGTLTTGVAIDVDAISGTMTNAYGLRIGNVTGGSSLDYAIYTGTGLVRFGDAVSSTSTITGTSLIGTTRVTAPLFGTTTGTDVVFDRNSVTQLTLGSLLATFAGAATVATTLTTNGTTASLVQSGTTATLNVGTGTGSGASDISIRGAAGQNRQLIFRSGTSARWSVYAQNNAESGADAGSTFNIAAYTDAGAFIDAPISINRAAGGAVTIVRPITHTATSANLVQSATSANVNIGSGTGSSSVGLSLRSAAGQVAGMVMYTGASSARWNFYKDSAAESGANAGSNLQLVAYDDAGASLGAVVSFTREAAGAITLNRVLNVNTASGIQVSGTKVVGAQGLTISDPTGGTVQDSEARTAINTIIDRLQAHGLIA